MTTPPNAAHIEQLAAKRFEWPVFYNGPDKCMRPREGDLAFENRQLSLADIVEQPGDQPSHLNNTVAALITVTNHEADRALAFFRKANPTVDLARFEAYLNQNDPEADPLKTQLRALSVKEGTVRGNQARALEKSIISTSTRLAKLEKPGNKLERMSEIIRAYHLPTEQADYLYRVAQAECLSSELNEELRALQFVSNSLNRVFTFAAHTGPAHAQAIPGFGVTRDAVAMAGLRGDIGRLQQLQHSLQTTKARVGEISEFFTQDTLPDPLSPQLTQERAHLAAGLAIIGNTLQALRTDLIDAVGTVPARTPTP